MGAGLASLPLLLLASCAGYFYFSLFPRCQPNFLRKIQNYWRYFNHKTYQNKNVIWDTLCFDHIKDLSRSFVGPQKLWWQGILLMFYRLFLSKISKKDRNVSEYLAIFRWDSDSQFLAANLIDLHLLSLSLLHHASLISPYNETKAHHALFFIWFSASKKYGCKKSGSDIFDVKNDQERYCHFGAVRAPRWLITANFFLYTFTFYHFACDNFHFSPVSFSYCPSMTIFTCHCVLSLFIIWPMTTFTVFHFHFLWFGLE